MLVGGQKEFEPWVIRWFCAPLCLAMPVKSSACVSIRAHHESEPFVVLFRLSTHAKSFRIRRSTT